MYTTYHFKSTTEINADIIEAIKAAFKGKSIVMTIEEEQDETEYLLSNDNNRKMLLKSLEQAKNGELTTIKAND